jgi:hypothetical protein
VSQTEGAARLAQVIKGVHFKDGELETMSSIKYLFIFVRPIRGQQSQSKPLERVGRPKSLAVVSV